MKQITFAVAAITASLTFVSPVLADDAHHPEKAAAAKPSAEQSSQTVKQMQDNVKKMRSQLDRVAKSKSSEERQKALAEHMHTMQENMNMAHRMAAGMEMGCPMMGQGMMGMGQMGGSPSTAAPADRMQQMERRMDMMEQMMKQQGGSPAPMPTK